MIVDGKERNYIVHDDNNVKGFFGEYRWLSNYHSCGILHKGLGFNSTEAAYQASKTNNIEVAKTYQNMTAAESKNASKLLTPPKNWHDVKFNVMAQLTFQKYLIHPELKQLLLDTGDKYLEETNHWNDTYWGVCNGIGENQLGKILMATRAYLKHLC